MSSPSIHESNTKLHTPLRSRIQSCYNDFTIFKATISRKVDTSLSTVRDGLAITGQKSSVLRSPDFNILENVWRMIKSRIKTYEHAITNLVDLIWDQITVEGIQKLARTMPERMQQARHRYGFAAAF